MDSGPIFWILEGRLYLTFCDKLLIDKRLYGFLLIGHESCKIVFNESPFSSAESFDIASGKMT